MDLLKGNLGKKAGILDDSCLFWMKDLHQSEVKIMDSRRHYQKVFGVLDIVQSPFGGCVVKEFE